MAQVTKGACRNGEEGVDTVSTPSSPFRQAPPVTWAIHTYTYLVSMSTVLSIKMDKKRKRGDFLDQFEPAEPPCSVSNGPGKMYLKSSVSGGLLYRTKHRTVK